MARAMHGGGQTWHGASKMAEKQQQRSIMAYIISVAAAYQQAMKHLQQRIISRVSTSIVSASRHQHQRPRANKRAPINHQQLTLADGVVAASARHGINGAYHTYVQTCGWRPAC